MDINFGFIILGMNTLIIFTFKREWLLKKNSFLVLLFINIILFAMGYLLEAKLIENPKLVVALKMPLISQLLFICMLICFRKIYNRDPVDTFWTMDRSLMRDGIFNAIFWFIGFVLPAILAFTKII